MKLVTDIESCNELQNSIAVTAEPVTDNELTPIGVNSKAVTWKPSDDYTRMSRAMKYGERCGKCEKPIGRFFPVVRGEAPFRHSGPFGSGTKYLILITNMFYYFSADKIKSKLVKEATSLGRID